MVGLAVGIDACDVTTHTWRAGDAGGVRSGAAVMRCRRALKLAAPAFARARGELPATGDLQSVSVTQRSRSDGWCKCEAAGCAQSDCVYDQRLTTAV